MGYKFKEIFSDTTYNEAGTCRVTTVVYYAWFDRMLVESFVYRKPASAKEYDDGGRVLILLRCVEAKNDHGTNAENIRFAMKMHEDVVREQFREGT